MVNRQIRRVRKILLVVLYIGLISVLQRLIFDFMGYMWVLVLFGLATMVFILFGLFGTHQQRTKFIITYMVWAVIWIVFNFIVILAYGATGDLTHKNNWLSFNENNKSWYYKKGLGCTKIEFTDEYKNCLVKFEHVEYIQASIQIFFALLGFGLAFRLRQLINIAKQFYIAPNVNPYASYVGSNRSATSSAASKTSGPFIITSSY